MRPLALLLLVAACSAPAAPPASPAPLAPAGPIAATTAMPDAQPADARLADTPAPDAAAPPSQPQATQPQRIDPDSLPGPPYNAKLRCATSKETTRECTARGQNCRQTTKAWCGGTALTADEESALEHKPCDCICDGDPPRCPFNAK